MDRKQFFQSIYTPVKSQETASKKELVKSSIAKYPTLTGLAPYTGTWGTLQAAHLLKRTMFGSTYSDIQTLVNQGMSSAVDSMLNLISLPLPPPPIKDYTTGTDTAVTLGTTWVNDILIGGAGGTNGNRTNSFKKWWVGLIINQDRNIREKMTVFWQNHFGIEADTIVNGNMIYGHNTYLRQNCLGNFKNMVSAVSTQAAMLFYLNNNTNTKTAPNENYARELMELFTLGKGPNSQYTQKDVETAAKALTGWRISNTNLAVSFDITKHDTTNKTFSSFFNSTVITGQTGATAGALELDSLINMIFAKDEVAKFICRKIYRFFVYYEIDSNVETNVITPLATIFVNNNYDILPVLTTLFKSEHFYDANVIASVIKPPLDKVLGLVREFNIPLPVASDYATTYSLLNKFLNKSISLNQTLADPPNVSGWPAYYQIPSFHELWINAASYSARVAYADLMVNSGLSSNGFSMQIDVINFAKTLSNPSDPNILIADVILIIYTVYFSPADILTLKINTLLGGQTSDSYWTTAWTDYIADPTNNVKKNIVKSRLTSLILTLIKKEEYQLS